VEHDPSSVNRFKEGVYNFGKLHWGVHCDDITFTFVWNTEMDEEGSGKAVVSGGTCISYFEVPEGRDIHKIGDTGLSIRDIERAGTLYSKEMYKADRKENGYAGMLDVIMFYGNIALNSLMHSFISFSTYLKANYPLSISSALERFSPEFPK
jgi:hypothetical protein